MNETASKVRTAMDSLTEQRNMLDAVLESMTEGVMAIGCDERLIGMNHFACELLGIDIEKARGRLIQEATRDVDLLGFIKTSLDSGKLEETEITLNGSRERIVKLTGSPLHGSDGSMTGAIVVLADCTKLRHLEGIRRDFVANVSHELKTPITSIKGFVETLLGGAKDSPEETRKFLEIISKHAARLNGIVEDLMELSRIEEAQASGSITLDEADPRKAVELSVAYMKDKADLKKIVIESDIKPGKCRMNLSLIEHAVSNLLDNAINYSEEARKVYVSGQAVGSDYAIKVRDEGIGIEKHHLPRIFERFYRVDKGRDRSKGGTGLGLAIVKHIMEAHGGSVSVESDLGIGSTFTITLPVSNSSQSANIS
jgi:two-component system phosphate regulon sensor histidine kinase PhoR